MLCCPHRPTLFKNKNKKKSRVGKAPNFAQVGCFFRKMMEYAPKNGPFGCLKKYFKRIIFRPTDPTFSEIPLEGNTTVIFWGALWTQGRPLLPALRNSDRFLTIQVMGEKK